MARAVSGGAVYVSDKPGQHDFELLRKLVLPDGTVLRAALPGRPTRDSLFCDPLRDGRSLLKVRRRTADRRVRSARAHARPGACAAPLCARPTHHGRSCSRSPLPALPQVWNINAVVGVVGVFNVQGASWDRRRRKFVIHDRNPPALSTTVAPHDVEPLRALAAAARRSGGGQQQGAAAADAAAGTALAAPAAGGGLEFASYRYSSRELKLLPAADASLPVTLPASGADTVWFSPVQRLGGVGLAPLGLVELYNGGGAVTSLTLSRGRPEQAGGGGDGASSGAPEVVAAVGVRGCGKLLAYSNRRPARVWVNMAPRDFSYEPYSGRLEVEVPQPAEGLGSEVEIMY
jgi:raffinose synthase